jgi:hypothetical protein
MATRVQSSALVDTDGFDVVGLERSLGIVDEVWLGEGGAPSALVVRLTDGSRGLLEVRDVTDIDVDTQQVHVAQDAQLLHLSGPEAVPQYETAPAPQIRKLPVVRSIAFMLGTLALIVCTLIGLDFLFAYLIGGGPPY